MLRMKKESLREKFKPSLLSFLNTPDQSLQRVSMVVCFRVTKIVISEQNSVTILQALNLKHTDALKFPVLLL